MAPFFAAILGILGVLGGIATTTCTIPLIRSICPAPIPVPPVPVPNPIPTPIPSAASAIFQIIAPSVPIQRNDEYEAVVVGVFYRPEQRDAAQRIVGVLNTAGFKTLHFESGLENVIVPDNRTGRIWIKSSVERIALKPVVRSLTLQGLAGKQADDVQVHAGTPLSSDAAHTQERGEIQIDLF